jgi:hypothetical protein
MYRPEPLHDDDLGTRRRALYEPSAAFSLSTPSSSLPPRVPTHDRIPRRDTSRVNRPAHSSVSYRSFVGDLDSNLADAPSATFGQSTDPAVPHPHRAYPQRVSRVRSVLSSSPSGSQRDSDSDWESDSEDEDSIMDDEHHHDDHVVDHLDVIGPPPSHVLPSIGFLTLLLHRPPSRHGRDSYERRQRYSSVTSPFLATSMFQLTLPQPTHLVLLSQASRYPSG